MTKNTSIALLPLDNRPVSYLLPKQIADFSGFDLILPDRKYLGDLNKGSDFEYLEEWCRGLINQTPTVVIALDNWVYGGLVQSRTHNFSMDVLRKRIKFAQNLKNISKYGFSTIMRIPNYNNSDEERDSWKDYGEKIYKWSELTYKVGRGVTEEGISHEALIENWYQSSKQIPTQVLADYKAHRDKNFSVNLLWLECLHDQIFKYLLFSSDDSSKFGMNVVEKEYLKQEISKHRLLNVAKVVSGTDEIPLVLLTKAVIDRLDSKPSLSVFFSSVQGKSNLPRYESDSIYDSLINQIQSLGIEIKELENSDIVLCIHCSDSMQGDHIFGHKPDDTIENVKKVVNLLSTLNKPFILLDLAYANGADPILVESLIKSDINWNNCHGFSAWNTCSNSIGSGLSIGVNRWIAEKSNTFNKEAFKKCLITRFLDDYAYQAKIRHSMVTASEINSKMVSHRKNFCKLFELSDINIKYSLPWRRSFEVEIEL